MEMLHPDNATRTIGAAQGYRPLSITDNVVVDAATGVETNQMTTLWRPDEKELRRLQDGAPIAVHLLGKGHPPIMVGVDDVPRVIETAPELPEPYQLVQAAQEALNKQSHIELNFILVQMLARLMMRTDVISSEFQELLDALRPAPAGAWDSTPPPEDPTGMGGSLSG